MMRRENTCSCFMIICFNLFLASRHAVRVILVSSNLVPRSYSVTGNDRGRSGYKTRSRSHSRAANDNQSGVFLKIERVSMECRKTKTKVISLTNQKGRRQYSKPIKTRSNYT